MLDTPTPRPPTDDELVERAREGELAAFEALMRRHNQRMFRVARAVLRSDAEAEDAVQDAYLRALTRLDQYRPGNFGAWLVTIALNEARGRLRKRRRIISVEPGTEHERVQASDPRTIGFAPNPERAAARRELRAALEHAIDSLDADDREIVILREVEQLSTREAASCLDLSESAVRTRLHRARARLRALLGERIAHELPELFSFDGARCDRLVCGVLARLRRHLGLAH